MRKAITKTRSPCARWEAMTYLGFGELFAQGSRTAMKYWPEDFLK
jgi:hypothetical protein